MLIFAGLVSFSFHEGWNRAETDFPNYYTAAVLVRKGAKLRNYYDWNWFQQQMNYAGVERQLGGYIPQTPLTMLPIVPVAALPLQAAKRVWLLAGIVFLAATIWLLSRITHFSIAAIALLALAGYGSLHVNFVLGQYYVFLLFLLTLAAYSLHRRRPVAGGVLLGTAFMLKMYGGSLLLYFAAIRNRKAIQGMLAGSLALAAAAVALFGWTDIVYFTAHILPRALKGETLDPYNPGNGTISTLLRRTFMPEPELNPHPLFNNPALFFFLQPFLTLTIAAFSLLAFRQPASPKIGFAGFMVASILISPNTASYTFLLLLLPIALLLEKAEPWKRMLLLICYAVLATPMRSSWSWLFPKVWILLLLLFLAGLDDWRRLKWKQCLISMVIVLVCATLLARRSFVSYQQEPGRHCQQIAVEPGAIYSSFPTVLRSGIIYESISAGRYLLHWQHGGRIDQFVFDGEAFHPVALSPEGPIQFELVAHGTSATYSFNPSTAKLFRSGRRTHNDSAPAVSPNGKWTAFTSLLSGTIQIFLRSTGDNHVVRLTGGDCNSFAPAWELNSQAVLFASDCDRGLGLPALYRARIPAPH